MKARPLSMRKATVKRAFLRNHRILRLRGIWHSGALFSAERMDKIKKLVDEELVSLGAEAEGVRQEKRTK